MHPTHRSIRRFVTPAHFISILFYVREVFLFCPIVSERSGFSVFYFLDFFFFFFSVSFASVPAGMEKETDRGVSVCNAFFRCGGICVMVSNCLKRALVDEYLYGIFFFSWSPDVGIGLGVSAFPLL